MLPLPAMSGRWPFIVGITTIVAVVACRDKTAAPKPRSSEGSGNLTPTGRAAISAPPGPALGSGRPRPALPPAPAESAAPAPTASRVFEAETRDARWAPTAEAEIARRFKKLRGGALESTECRHSQCRITVAGTEAEVAQTITELEGSRGLHGFAASVMLTAPERKPDGTIVLRAFARFDR